jgi:O-antigen/teichoic acid export membrane protein
MNLPSWRSLISAEALRSTGQLAVGQAFALLGMFASGVLVARALQPSSYGLYAAAFSLGSLTVGGATAGVPILILRRASEADLDRALLQRALVLLIVSLAVAVSITSAIGAGLFGGARGAIAGAAAGLFFATNNLATLGQYVQIGRRRYHRSAATDITAGTLFPILSYSAIKLHAGVDGCLIAIAFACAISCSVAWTRLPNLEFDGVRSPLQFRDSLSLGAFGLMNGSYGRIDTPTLLAVAGAAAAGFYSAAYRLLGPFALIGTAFGTFYFARISEQSGNSPRWNHLRSRGSFLFAVSSIGSTAVMIIFALDSPCSHTSLECCSLVAVPACSCRSGFGPFGDTGHCRPWIWPYCGCPTGSFHRKTLWPSWRSLGMGRVRVSNLLAT